MKNKLRSFAFAGCALLLAAAVPSLTSCGSSEEPAAEAAKPARSPAEDCLAAANAARAAALEGRIGDLYGMLPASWQGDLDGQLRLLATKIDKPAFAQITGLAGELASLADEKGDLIRECLKDEMIGVSTIDDAVLAGALRAVSEWKYEDFQAGNFNALFGDRRVAGLLALVVRQAMEANDASFSEFTFADPSQTDRVTLRVTSTEAVYEWDADSKSAVRTVKTADETLDWERFEDRWVPSVAIRPEGDWADEGFKEGVWKLMMDDLRSQIDALSKSEISQLTMGLGMARMVVPMIKQCETADDLKRILRNFD